MSVLPTVLITGATDGLGLALARSFDRRGARLLLLGRRPADALPEDLRSVTYCQADLGERDAAERLSRFLDEHSIARLDLVIHNAGLGYYGPPEAQALTDLRALIDVNLRAPIALTHAALPRLAAARGRVVLISSVAAVLPTPQYAVYAATKAGLESFARNLRAELDTVAVQLVALGAVRTGMHAKSGMPADRLRSDRFPPPEQVAEQVVAAIESGRDEVTIGALNRWLRRGGRWLPRVADLIATRMR